MIVRMSNRRKSFSDQIRRAILNAPISRYEMCKHIGMTQSLLSRFVNGKGGLSIDALDKVAELIGISVAEPKKTKGR